MPSDAPTVCKTCGFTNVPGDQFCGSCGAFLDWDGVPAEASAPIADPPPPTPPEPIEIQPGDTRRTASPPAPQASATAAAVSDDDGEDLVRCPACGIANPSTRTFCLSCGTTLATAARIEPATPEQIAKAVAWTPTGSPTTAPPKPPVAGKGESRSRGIPGWVVWVGAIGVLVGVAIVLASVALRSPNPDSGATGSGAAASGPASSQGPGSSGGTSSSAPGTAVALPMKAATASSVVGNQDKFKAERAIDGDPATSWQEGSRQEKGEWIEVTFDPSRADTLLVRNGYQASQALYRGNRRLKDITVSVNGGAPIQARLKDTMKVQEIDLGGVPGATSVKITIVSTYPAEKTSIPKTPFDDAALSEISVLGVPGG